VKPPDKRGGAPGHHTGDATTARPHPTKRSTVGHSLKDRVYPGGMQRDVSLPGDHRVQRDAPVEILRMLYVATEADLVTPGPEFGSWGWLRLDPADPRRTAATTRAALAWWNGVMFGPGLPADVLDRLVAERLNSASKDVAAAVDWRAVVREHAAQQRAMRLRLEGHRPAASLPPAPAALVEAFERAGRGAE
jgi:hypothetical protein